MDKADLSRAWAAQAQALAEQGIVECRMCRRREDLEGALQIWRNGALVYAICERCTLSHDILITPTERGTEVRAKRRRPYVLLDSKGGVA
jgi:hypothetical protein